MPPPAAKNADSAFEPVTGLEIGDHDVGLMLLCKLDGIADAIGLGSTAILIVTGHADMTSTIAAIRQGVDDYLIKPVPNGVLVAHLKKLIRRSKRAQVSA